MKRHCLYAAVALGLAVWTNPFSVHAQAATSLQQAELAGLKAENGAEVQNRFVAGGQTVGGTLTTMLLNNKLQHPANQIVKIDLARGAAAVEKNGGGIEAVNFDPTTLQLR